MEMISLQRAAAGSGWNNGLPGCDAVGALVFFSLVAIWRWVEGAVVVLDDVGKLITIPILLYIIIQIRLHIATISIKFWLVWSLLLWLLVRGWFFRGVDIGDLPIYRQSLIGPRQLFRWIRVMIVKQILILQGLWKMSWARLWWACL